MNGKKLIADGVVIIRNITDKLNFYKEEMESRKAVYSGRELRRLNLLSDYFESAWRSWKLH